MNDSLKEKLIELLKDQKEIFGDDLFEEMVPRKTEIITGENQKISFSPKKQPVMNKSASSNKKVYDKQFAFSECEDPAKQAIESWESSESLEELHKKIGGCTKCVLHEGRNKFVFGVGNANADVMCIGEGPGAEEDKQGFPFVGRAGKLLTDILKAIKFSRDEVFIGNVVKCRPPGNRTPLPSEMDTCSPYLLKQIDLIKPKLILCLGLTAAQGLLNKKDSLTSMRGKIFEFRRTKVMVTYHPAALLRNPQWKKGCWEDVQKFRKLYDELD
jgi:uracil-DNA glycosylase family 4